MNHPFDDERWAPGRDVIEREKAAARIWLAGREWNSAGAVRKSLPSRPPGRSARIAAAAAGVAALFLGVLLLRPVFRPRSSAFLGPADTISKVFGYVQAESVDSLSVTAILNDAAASEAAWSMQRVFCKVALEDTAAGGLPRLIERALEKLREAGGFRPEGLGRKEPRRSHLSEMFLRLYQSIKEG